MLALLALLLALGYSRTGLRARRLNRQREKLLEDIGLLQAALLPTVPEKLGDLGVSVAYRPAEGPGAGGDFYDAFAIDDDRVALIVGDISGHGREALGHTTLVHYTLRAYLEAGLEPRTSLQLAGQAMGDKLGESFATVVAARWDSRSGTLTYACAGHPPPVIAPDGAAPEPVTALSSPPIGVGEATGRRQSTITLPSGSVACFFTDGLIEARVDGKLFGRERLTRMVAELTHAGPASAQALLERVRRAADEVSDDMAACVLSPGDLRRRDQFWTEELELDDRDARQPELELFLAACHLDAEEIQRARAAAEAEVERAGGAVLSVRHHAGASRWEVGPREVETLLHGTGVATPAAAGAR